MRKLTPTRIAQMRVRTIALATAPVLTAGLLVFTPVAQAADGATPSPEDTTSVPVTNVPTAAKAAPEAEDKTVPLPEPTWPREGKTTEVEVDEEFPAASADVSVRSEDPEKAPESVDVESLGKLPDGNKFGPGVAYTIEPASPELETPQGPGTPEPTDPAPPTPEPTQTTPPPAAAAGVLYRSNPLKTPAPGDDPHASA